MQPYGGALVLPLGCSGACGSFRDPVQTLEGVPGAAAALPHGGGVVDAEHANGAARVLEAPAAGPCECGGTQEPAAVLLFCRTLRSPDRAPSPSQGAGVSPSKLRSFVYCGRLRAPRVDWAGAGGYGEVIWTLQVGMDAVLDAVRTFSQTIQQHMTWAHHWPYDEAPIFFSRCGKVLQCHELQYACGPLMRRMAQC